MDEMEEAGSDGGLQATGVQITLGKGRRWDGVQLSYKKNGCIVQLVSAGLK